MEEHKTATRQRLTTLFSEGHDDYGALELTLGGAILLGYLFRAALPQANWLDLAALVLLVAGALWLGNQVEHRLLFAQGRRRFRGTLLLHVTWIVAACALLLSGLLMAVAHARTWNWQRGWADGPILVMLALGLYYLAQGLRLGVARWVYLGVVLSLWSVAIPGVPVLREHLFLSSALLVGGAMMASGYIGRRAHWRQMAASSKSVPA